MRNFTKRCIILLLCLSIVMFLPACGPKEDEQLKVRSAEDAAAQLKDLADRYGYENALSELTESITNTIGGDSYYRLQQNFQGIPVYGRTVVCATEGNNDVTSITGNIIDIDPSTDLTPSIADSDVITAITNYLELQLGDSADGFEFPSLGNDSLCLYVLDDSGKTRLSFKVTTGIYEFIVDAHNAEILLCTPTVFETTSTVDGYAASDTKKENSFPIEKRGEYYYVLSDPTKKITVYTFNGRVSKEDNNFFKNRSTIVESTDNIFGNTEAEIALEYEKGVQLLQNVIKIQDFFSSLGFSSLNMPVNLFYNDGLENALGGTVDGCGTISMGETIGVNHVDVIAHEYTHFVSRVQVHWIGSCENGALNEAISDIMGEIIESKVTGNEIDWMLGTYRNIQEPYLLKNPVVYKGVDWKETEKPTEDNDSGYVHNNSTVISHAAYLMWYGDDDKAKAIATDDLAELWYRAMLMMPSDCTFLECRHLVEIAAQSMKQLSATQIKSISEAFDTVGIRSTDPEETELTYRLKPNSSLAVLSNEGEPYTGYTLEIFGLKNTVLWADGDEMPQEGYIGGSEYHYTVEITETPFTLSIPSGYYIFTISDKHFPELTYSFTASINGNGTEDEITVFTGYESVLVVPVTDPTEESSGVTAEIAASYIPKVESAIEDSSFCDMLELASGTLCDLDGDGTEELVLSYFRQELPYIPYFVYDVHDYENGHLKTYAERKKINAGLVAGSYGYIGVEYYDNQPVLVTYTSNGETWREEGYPDVKYELTVFDGNTCEPSGTLWVHTCGSDVVYKINSVEVSEEDFSQELSHYSCISMSDSEWSPIVFEPSYEPMTLPELLEYLNSVADGFHADESGQKQLVQIVEEYTKRGVLYAGRSGTVNLYYTGNNLLSKYEASLIDADGRKEEQVCTFEYDSFDRVIQEEDCRTSDYGVYSFTYTYEYDQHGRLLSRSSRSSQGTGSITSYVYNSSNQLSSMYIESTEQGNAEYLYDNYVLDADGRIQSYTSRCTMGDHRAETTYRFNYYSDGSLSEESSIADWGFYTEDLVKKYIYDYAPFTLIEYSNASGSTGAELVYLDFPPIPIDETASFTMEDGYLTKVTGATYSLEFIYR